MRNFFTLFLTTVFVLSVNASTYEKRQLFGFSQSCIKSFMDIEKQLHIIFTDLLQVDDFEPLYGPGSSLNINNEEQKLEKFIKTATNECCSKASIDATNKVTVKPEHALSFFASIARSVLNSMEKKKAAFDEIPTTATAFRGHLFYLNGKFDGLLSCLISDSRTGFGHATV